MVYTNIFRQITSQRHHYEVIFRSLSCHLVREKDNTEIRARGRSAPSPTIFNHERRREEEKEEEGEEKERREDEEEKNEHS